MHIFTNLKSLLVSTGVMVCFSSLCNEKRKGVDYHPWLVKMYNWVLETFYRFFLQLPCQVIIKQLLSYLTIHSKIELENKVLLVCSKFWITRTCRHKLSLSQYSAQGPSIHYYSTCTFPRIWVENQLSDWCWDQV